MKPTEAMNFDLFDGDTFIPELDGPRLGKTLAAVRDLMRDGQWRTLSEIRSAVRFSGVRATEASVSARLRDLRKPRFGGHTIERERRNNGLFVYRMKRG